MMHDIVPRFARGHRLHHDRVRNIWLIQAPEKAYLADETAVHILRLIDGKTALNAILDTLTPRFSAPKERIEDDVVSLLKDLAAKGVLRL